MDLQTRLKRKAARHAVTFIRSGMIVGLGTGSTSRFAIERLGELLRDQKLRDITGIPSSLQSEKLARQVSIPLADFDEHAVIDATIDGADEVDPDLNLIKGGGGALLREKVLAQNSRRNIIIVDDGKMSDHLGRKWAVPVEVIPFARRCLEDFLKDLGASVSMRKSIDGTPFWTDQHNQILDADFGVIQAPHELAARLSARAGVVDHGLFLDLASDVIVAEPNRIRHLQRGDERVSETIIPDP
jgi:ribose 5-phosphate isomerase A